MPVLKIQVAPGCSGSDKETALKIAGALYAAGVTGTDIEGIGRFYFIYGLEDYEASAARGFLEKRKELSASMV